MKHPSFEDLVLYFYNEPVDRAAIEQHLAVCPACRAERVAIEESLAAVSAWPLPERANDYGQAVWQQIAPRLASAGHRDFFGFLRPLWQPRWALAGAMATLLVAAFIAGRLWQQRVTPPPPTFASETRDRVLAAAVADHLERSEILLRALQNSDGTRGAEKVDFSYERTRAAELVDGNWLYQESAEQAGDAGLASLLDDLGRTLETVAHSPDQLSADELAELRHRIEAQGILFKIEVVDSRLEESIKSTARRPSPANLTD